MVISAIDFFGGMVSEIGDKSWRVQSPDGLLQTIVDNEIELNDLVNKGYTIIKEFNK